MTAKPVTLLYLLDGYPVVMLYYPPPLGPALARQTVDPAGGGLDLASGGELRISGVAYDSRRVQSGNLFVAIKGGKADGHRYVVDALNRGARAVVVDETEENCCPDAYFHHMNAAKVVVHDTRRALAYVARKFYRDAVSALRIVGVTGTNGKTTTTYLLHGILNGTGVKAGLIGTIEYMIGDEVREAVHTTPESLDLHALLAEMVKRGLSWAVMEVSSHALALERVYGVPFEAAVFTNLTQDHLDFHGTMERYFAEKKKLFDSLSLPAHAVTNNDDNYGRRIIEGTSASVTRYALGADADVRGENVRLSFEGTELDVVFAGNRVHVKSPLIGRFNAANILAAFAAVLALGLPVETIVSGIASVRRVRGRFEPIRSTADWTAIVDYAHTPDAIEKCLTAIHDIVPGHGRGRVITVFGAGGDRDREKRPKMMRAAAEASDLVIVTSDNPRSEDPAAIIEEIAAGAPHGLEHRRITDRREAIYYALSIARGGDVVLVAGKGHEQVQIVGDRRFQFDDRTVIEEYIREHAA